ncbi:transposase [Streptomyces sp. NPDC059489]|uniref:transposase n=1 Tax=Streptomyces sp. NPDC059489 TaxID=3346849 RepID=UPI00367B75C2
MADRGHHHHTASHGTYGIRRVHAELRLGHGIPVSHGTVMLRMQRSVPHARGACSLQGDQKGQEGVLERF